MPRNSSGTFTLVTGNPVVAGTTIESTWANTTLSDIATELTNSLSRTGQGGMTAAFRLADGTLAAPGLAFLNETGTGLYRAGSGEMWSAVQGAQIQQYTINGVLIPTGKTFTAQGDSTLANLSYTGTLTGGTGVVNLGSGQFYKDASGNVGIGTATPGSKLHVAGDIQQDNAQYLKGKLAAGTATRLFGLNALNALYIGSIDADHTGGTLFVKNGATQMTLDASGNLGIGTASPTSKLSVVGDIRATTGGALILNNPANAAAGSVLFNASDALVFNGGGSTERMRLDASGNLGIGTSSPGSYGVLAVDTSKGATGVTLGDFTTLANDTQLYMRTSGLAKFVTTAGGSFTFGSSGGSERMRLDANGNLGIGTSSPDAKLQVVGTTYLGADSAFVGTGDPKLVVFGSTATETSFHIFQSGIGSCLMGFKANDATLYLTNTYAGNALGSNGLALDASGNLGLGVTPSAWRSADKALQVRSTVVDNVNSTTAVFGLNYYRDASAVDRYINTDRAAQIVLNAGANGSIAFNTAPSGTAGDPISFTQAMTLDASGQLQVGGTTAFSSAGGRGNISINGSSGAILGLGVSNTVRGYLFADATHAELDAQSGYLQFNAGSAERARITSGGDLLVGQVGSGPFNLNSVGISPATTGGTDYNHANGTVSGVMYERFNYNATTIGSITQSGTTAVLYNTTSDQRLKTNIVDAPDAAALIDSIKVRSFDWISDDSHQRYGMVAQELFEVAPEAVHAPADPDAMMAVDYSKLVPMLIKEVQSLRARVAALEA